MKIETTKDLLKILKPLQDDNKNDLSKSQNYRYVVYARKSTDSEEKQVRSLADQISECQDFAAHSDLDIKTIVQESESAKEPDIRPKFRTVIDDVKRGKYDGIIAWHPDRLARNMKDAGEVIDLIDKNIIKDLKFPSFTFENSTSGKMLLGITFVLSKQYSDQLSDNVSRGIRRNIEEGKYVNKVKHGYFKDSDQFQHPDGKNFILIKKAFLMRKEGAIMKDIAEYLNKNEYQKVQKDGTRKLFRMNYKKIEKILRDPFYAGVMIYGKKGGAADLTEVYDFQPAVSVPDFMKINKLANNKALLRLANRFRGDNDVKADLMRQMIICADCEEPLFSGITTKKTKKGTTRYFYYRCDTEDCPRKNKSVRAKVVIDFIIKFLTEKPFSSKESYDKYAKEMEKVSIERTRNIKSLLLSQKMKKAKLKERMAKMKDMLLDETDEIIRKAYKRDFKKIDQDIRNATMEIIRLEALSKTTKSSILTYAEFLELMEKMPKIIGSIKKMKELDYIIKKVFSNFIVRGKNVEKLRLKEPFHSLRDPKWTECGP